MPQLVIVEGPEMGTTYEVDGELAIGCGPGVDVTVDERRMKRPARVVVVDGRAHLESHGDAVRVNGMPQQRVPLQHGDMISCGSTVLLFSEDSPGDPLPDEPGPAPSQILSRRALFEDAESVVMSLGVDLSADANSRLVTLYKIAALLTEADGLETAVERLLVLVVDALEADRGFVLLVDEDERTISQRFWWSRKEGRLKELPGVSRSLLRTVTQGRQGVVSASTPEEEDLSTSMTELGVCSTMMIPLLRQGRLHGVLGVDSLDWQRSFTDADLTYLSQIGVQASMCIATLQTYEEPAQFSKNLRSLGRATQWLSSYLDRDAILKETVAFACSIFQCRRASIMLKEDDGALRLSHGIGVALPRDQWADVVVHPGEGIAGRVLASGEAVNARAEGDGAERGYHGDSYMVVPIRDEKAGVMGVVNVTDKLSRRSFGSNDLELLTILANQAGIALTNAALYEKATVDNLTRLHVRRYFFQRLSELVKKARQREQPLSLLMLDLDHFKRLNDTYGHPAGDAVLRSAGKLLRSLVRNVDVASRYGGEEFAVILPDADVEVASRIGERIRAAIAAHGFEHDGDRHSVTVSIGIASLHEDERRDHLIKRADQALYDAKDRGRNLVAIAADDVGRSATVTSG